MYLLCICVALGHRRWAACLWKSIWEMEPLASGHPTILSYGADEKAQVLMMAVHQAITPIG